MDNYLEVLGVLKERIKEVEKTLQEKAEITEEAKWLMSIVGIGFHNVLLILSEIGEIERDSANRRVSSAMLDWRQRLSNPGIIRGMGT